MRLENLVRDGVRDTSPGRPFVRIRNVAPLSVEADGKRLTIADHAVMVMTNAPHVVCFGTPD